jgi:hypothetical protein
LLSAPLSQPHPIELLEQVDAGQAELARGMRVIMAGPRGEPPIPALTLGQTDASPPAWLRMEHARFSPISAVSK